MTTYLPTFGRSSKDARLLAFIKLGLLHQFIAKERYFSSLTGSALPTGDLSSINFNAPSAERSFMSVQCQKSPFQTACRHCAFLLTQKPLFAIDEQMCVYVPHCYDSDVDCPSSLSIKTCSADSAPPFFSTYATQQLKNTFTTNSFKHDSKIYRQARKWLFAHLAPFSLFTLNIPIKKATIKLSKETSSIRKVSCIFTISSMENGSLRSRKQYSKHQQLKAKTHCNLFLHQLQ